MFKVGITFQRNEYGYPVIEGDDRQTAYRRLMSDEHGLRSLVAAMMAHKVTGAAMGLMFALGFVGWAWTFLVSP